MRGRLPEVTRERLARIAHCPQGHAYTTENTAYRASGARRCKECYRIRARAQYERIRILRVIGSPS